MTDTTSELPAARGSRIAAGGGLTLLAFLIFVVTNGSAPVAIRITFEELTPLWSGGARYLLAGLLLWGVVAIRRVPLPRGRNLRGALLFGALSTGVSPILLLFGLAHLTSSLYQTLVATIPLITLFLATAHGQERITRRGIVGAVVAMAGTAVAVGGVRGTHIEIVWVLVVFAGGAAMAEAAVIARGLEGVKPLALNAIALTLGGTIVLTVSRVLGDPWVIPVSTRVWVAIVYTTIFAVVIGFLLYVYVLQQWSASRASYSFLLAPLVTATLAAIVTEERITVVFALGTALVLVGVYIGAFVRKRVNVPIPMSE